MARPTRLAAGQVLLLADDAGDGCYVVVDGLLKVTVISPSGGERILALLGAGTLVGELSMIDGGPRSSSAYALHQTSLRFISRADFQGIRRAKSAALSASVDFAGQAAARHRRGRGREFSLPQGTRRARLAQSR
jgi:CRP-like cAMP-binding protein